MTVRLELPLLGHVDFAFHKECGICAPDEGPSTTATSPTTTSTSAAISTTSTTNTSKGTETSGATHELPVVPVAIGVAIVVLVSLVGAVLLLRRTRKPRSRFEHIMTFENPNYDPIDPEEGLATYEHSEPLYWAGEADMGDAFHADAMGDESQA